MCQLRPGEEGAKACLGVHSCVPVYVVGCECGCGCGERVFRTPGYRDTVQAVPLLTDLPSYSLLTQQHLINILFPSSLTVYLFSTFCWKCLLCSGRWMSQRAHCFVTRRTVNMNFTLKSKNGGDREDEGAMQRQHRKCVYESTFLREATICGILNFHWIDRR